MNTMDIRLQQAIAAARAGKRDEARILLDRFLADEPDDVHGMFLRSTLASSPEERVGSLRKVLEVDPEHRGAKLMLDRLGEAALIEPVVAEEEPEEVVAAVTDAEAEIEEPAFVEVEAAEEEEDIFETIVHPIAEMEEYPTDDEDFLDFEEEEDIFDEIDASAVALFADEFSEDLLEEEEQPAIDETMVAFAAADAFDEEEEEEFPFYAEDEELLAPVDEDEFPPLADEDEEIPEWLTDEAAFKAEEALALEEEEELPLEMGELPDWLQEEPTEDWLTMEPAEQTVVAETIQDEWVLEPLDLPEEDFVVKPDEYVKPKKKKSKVSTRILEIGLGLLILLAVLMMAGLVIVFFTS